MSEWETAALGDILELKYGKALKKEDRVGGSVAVVGSSGIVGWHDSAIVDAPTLVVGRKGSIGSLTLTEGRSWPIDTAYFTSFDRSRVDLGWLRHQLSGFDLKALNKAAAVPGLNREDVYRLRTIIPPLAEQRRIASTLDEADAIRTKRRAQLAHLDELPQSLFHEMFGGCTTLNRLGEVISKGPTNGLYKPASLYGSGTPILRIDGFSRGIITSKAWKRVQTSEDDLGRFSLRVHDIIINRVNALSHLGKSALIERLYEPSVYESNMMKLRVNPLLADPVFATAWLQTADAKHQILGRAKKAINQASINQADVRSLLMPIPPLLEQKAFADRVAAIRAERDRVACALEADDELLAALQHRAFRGEL